MNICLTQLGRIGDMILLTAVLPAIKSKYPDCNIDIIAGRGNHFVLNGNPYIRRVIVYNKSISGIIKFIREIRRQSYDYYIDPKDHYSSESKIIAKLIRAKSSVGFNRNGEKTFDFSVDSKEQNKGLHYIERFFKALNSLPQNPVPQKGRRDLKNDNMQNLPRPNLFVTGDSEQRIAEFTGKLPQKPILLVNISAGSTDRMWSGEKWIELFERLDSDNGNKYSDKYNLILTNAPSEEETAKAIINRIPYIYHFRTHNFHDTISIIKASAMMITPDTATVHVASAFNTPLVAIYGGMADNTAKFYPLSDHFIIIQAENGFDSIENVTVEAVYDMVLQMKRFAQKTSII